jgi:hypothetical protein
MKRPSPGLIAVIGVPMMMVGVALYMPQNDNPFSWPATLEPTTVTVQEIRAAPVEVRSAAIVPGAARTRVVVAAPDPATSNSTVRRLLAAGYPSAVAASAVAASVVQPGSGSAVYFAAGFESEAAGVALALGMTATPVALPPEPITDDDGSGDVIVVLG